MLLSRRVLDSCAEQKYGSEDCFYYLLVVFSNFMLVKVGRTYIQTVAIGCTNCLEEVLLPDMLLLLQW